MNCRPLRVQRPRLSPEVVSAAAVRVLFLLRQPGLWLVMEIRESPLLMGHHTPQTCTAQSPPEAAEPGACLMPTGWHSSPWGCCYKEPV